MIRVYDQAGKVIETHQHTKPPSTTAFEGPACGSQAFEYALCRPLFVRPDLFFAGEKLVETRVLPDRVPYWIDLQLLNGNVKADRH